MGKDNLQNYIKEFNNPKSDKTLLYIRVLSAFPYDTLIRFRKKVPLVFKSVLRLPYLKKKRYEDIFKNGHILFTDCIDIFGALAFIIENNAADINRYVKLKDELDYHTVLGHYPDAYGILDRIEREVCFSMTGTFYRLKLTRLDKGIAACTALHNKIHDANSSLSYIVTIAFKSSAVDMPFEEELEYIYNLLEGEDEHNDFTSAFAYPFKDFKTDSWLSILPATSIIDLYEGFLLHIGKLTPDRLNEPEIKRAVGVLASSINDVRLQRWASLLNISTFPASDSKTESRNIAERFYAGDYEGAMDAGIKYLERYPLDSTIYDIMMRCSEKTGKLPEPEFDKNSLARSLFLWNCFSYQNESYSDVFRMMVRNLCKAWYSIPCMRQILEIQENITKCRSERLYSKFWAYSPYPEIRDCGFYKDTAQALEYLRREGLEQGKSIQADIMARSEADVYNQSKTLISGISPQEIQYLQNDVIQGKVFPGICGFIISRIFESLIRESRIDEAVNLFVRFKLRFPYIVVNIDKKRVAKLLSDSEDARVANQMELAAFYTMIDGEVYKRYLAYKRALRQLGIRKASEIKETDDALVSYFIGKVADRKVLNLHLRVFDTEDKVDRERIALCRLMEKEDEDKIYADEITAIIKEQEERTLYQQVSDSKIHVDIEQLTATEFSKDQQVFEVYKSVDENLEYLQTKDIEGFIKYVLNNLSGERIIELHNEPVKYKKELFRQLMKSLRDKFLFDPRYGLDKYLSSRIRHGTLITQLRNHLLSHSLVTNIDETGMHTSNKAWTKSKILSDEMKEKIQERLREFSEWIDALLFELKDERIQIKTERNPQKVNGLFDFSIIRIKEEIDQLGETWFETFDAFVKEAVELLWKQTNSMLKDVRQFLADFQKDVLEEMTNLQRDISNLLAQDYKTADKFNAQLLQCRIDFQDDVSEVMGWFKPEQSKVKNFTLKQAVDTAMAVINRINQDQLKLKTCTIEDEIIYNGRFFNAFYDIFYDMLNNILGYEKGHGEMADNAKIIVNRDGDFLSIEVSNPIEAGDLDDKRQIIDEQENFRVMLSKGKSRHEKNSGCVKIYSTVYFSLGGELYKNAIEETNFVARIRINTKKLEYHEDPAS